MDEESILPDWLEAHGIEDNRFAAAYAAASDRQRSLCKALIAALWSMSPPRRTGVEMHAVELEQGCNFLSLTKPLRWAVLCMDASAASPGLVLAALLPALTAGVGEILVVGLGSDSLPAPVLAALELAGQERVVELEGPQARELAGSLSKAGDGLVMCLGLEAIDIFRGSPLPRWSPRTVLSDAPLRSTCSLGVFIDKKNQYSRQLAEDISFMLPSVEVEWWSPSGKFGPKEALKRAGGFEFFEQKSFDAVLVPDYLSQQAFRTCPAVLGLGRAGHWLWPDLIEARFRLHHAAML